jgi:hemerythrin
MQLFNWDNKYSVNNKELDNHHKNLFAIFNKLYDSCLAKDNNINLGTIVEELVSYVNYHFAAEEKHMQNIGYKDIIKHISAHCYFKDRISKQLHTDDLNDIVISKELVLYLWNWLLNHVMIEDKKYSFQSNRRF